MFSRRVEDRATMEQAVAAYAARLGEKLRREGLGTDHVTVFYHTSEHEQGGRPRSVCTTVSLPEASSNTLLLARAATCAVRRTRRDGHRYSKAGIVTMDLMRLAGSQRALPGVGQQDRERSGALMAALDACNRRFGRGTVVTASAGMPMARGWATKFDMRSPRYTTRVSELPVVGATLAAPPATAPVPRRAALPLIDLRPPTAARPSPRITAMPSMPGLEAYDIVEDDDGTFSVVFARTGTVVVWNGKAQRGLGLEGADDAADHLEATDRISAARGTGTMNA